MAPIELHIDATCKSGPLSESYAGGPQPPQPPKLTRAIQSPLPFEPSMVQIKLDIDAARKSGPLFESYAGGPKSLDLVPILLVPTLKRPDKLKFQVYQNVDTPRETELEEIRDVKSSIPKDPNDVFEELTRLGKGGHVHTVKHKGTGVIFVRKKIFVSAVTRRQLTRELNIATTADHPNIIKSYGMYHASDIVNIIMEFCEGRSLDVVGKQMKEVGVVVDEKIYGRLAEGILQGLDYLHGRKIVHRDIRPQNVLLSREGVVKLCNFAVVGELLNSYAATFTGTFICMAPERISGADYTIRSDVWSTGITLLEMVMDRCPFPSDLSSWKLFTYIVSEDPPQLEDENDRDWSDEMKDFFKQTLTADPHVRPTPKDMLQHLWITTVMGEKDQMAQWIQTVWGWSEPRLSTSPSPSDKGRSQ